ncbi:hypothetical protein CXP40_14735 [Pseudomonas sp. YY-1]|nr:hypothetical protein CXP40_14735 [Pseudomonas sp. YY-1]
MPAQAGIQNQRIIWAPAFAGVTIAGFSGHPQMWMQRRPSAQTIGRLSGRWLQLPVHLDLPILLAQTARRR